MMELLRKPSLLTRLVVGKLTGLVIGLIAFIALPWLDPDASLALRFGFFFWYVTVGALIGLVGVFDRHPLFPTWRLNWWLVGPAIGAWMNFMLTLFARDDIQPMVAVILGESASPYLWFTLDGAMTGAIIAYFATRFGGQGPETVTSGLAKGQRSSSA